MRKHGHDRRMRARALSLGLVVLAAPLLSSGPFARADDEKLLWGLTEDLHRFELEENLSSEHERYWLGTEVVETVRLLRGSDFDRKRPRAEVLTLGEAVWFLALLLPGDVAGASAPVQERFELGDRTHLRAQGTEEIERKDGTISLKATIDISPADSQDDARALRLAEGTKLVLERTFDSKSHAVTEAKFDISINFLQDRKPKTQHRSGTIRLKGKVDAASKELLEEVKAAIGRGAAALKGKLDSEVATYAADKKNASYGYALGHVALSTFALLRSGVPESELKAAFDFMATCAFEEVYSVSLYIMCLEARHVRRSEVRPQADGHTVARFRKDPVSDPTKKEMIRAAKWLLDARSKGAWSYKGDAKGAGDRSNSQFATLALNCAASSGCPVDAQVWKDVADEVALSQEADGPLQRLGGVVWTPAAPCAPPAAKGTGSKAPSTDEKETAKARGWGYSMAARASATAVYGSMSAAGLSTAAIAREHLRRAKQLDADLDARTRRAIHDGVAWFLVNWTAQGHNRAGVRKTWDDFYYLYSVEKAMEMAGVESLAGHDWWREGCAYLLAVEEKPKKGLWAAKAGVPDVTATSFALLFLNRATLPAKVVVTDKVQVVTGDDEQDSWDLVKVEGLGFVHLEQAFEALADATPEKSKDVLRTCEKGWELVLEESRPRLVSQLILLLAHASKDVQRFARRALKSATGGFEDAAKAQAFFEQWSRLDLAAETHDYAAIPEMRAALVAADSTAPLKRAARTALVRLRAVEALGDVISELSTKDQAERREAASALAQLAGGQQCPFDPAAKDDERSRQEAAWKAWWEKNRDALVVSEDARRAVERLARPSLAASAEARLRELGKRAVPALVDGLVDARTKDRSLALLREITKQSFPADRAAWLAWWEKEKDR